MCTVNFKNAKNAASTLQKAGRVANEFFVTI